MRDFLIKLKLIDYLSTELQIEKKDFLEKLRATTDKGSVGIFINPFEVFSSSQNELKGQIYENGFKLQRRRRFFDSSANLAVATGKLSEKDYLLIIETEINGFNSFFIFFYVFLILIYSIFLVVGFVIPTDSGIPFFIIPFIIVHASIMFLLPYFLMRRSVKRLKYELEREFFYLTKK